jgi:hypothetical protein
LLIHWAKCFFPNAEENNEIESGMMASLHYREQATKQWKLFIAAEIAGALNVVLFILFSGVFR